MGYLCLLQLVPYTATWPSHKFICLRIEIQFRSVSPFSGFCFMYACSAALNPKRREKKEKEEAL